MPGMFLRYFNPLFGVPIQTARLELPLSCHSSLSVLGGAPEMPGFTPVRVATPGAESHRGTPCASTGEHAGMQSNRTGPPYTAARKDSKKTGLTLFRSSSVTLDITSTCYVLQFLQADPLSPTTTLAALRTSIPGRSRKYGAVHMPALPSCQDSTEESQS